MVDRVVRVRAIPRPGETVAARSSATFAGGKGANQAAAAAKCGACVRMLGRTGRDGAFIVEALRAAGVDVAAIRTDDPVSGAATVMVSDAGENAIVIAPESNTRIARADIDAFLASARAGDFVLLQNECSELEHAVRASSALDLRVWLNAAPADASLASLPLELLDGLVVNETESEALSGLSEPARALERLSERLPRATVIVTLGADGAIAACGATRLAHAGFTVDAVDTVGCGDAFVGAFLAEIAAESRIDRGEACARAILRGNAAGALAAMRAGAIPSLPTRGEVDAACAVAERGRLAPRGMRESTTAAARGEKAS